MTARADDRAATEVGRNARLELAFEVRNGRTVLAHGYAEPPLRIGRTFEEGRGVHLILASSSPGVFDRDRMQHVVRLGAGAVVRLTSQSAMQLHASPPGGPAVLSSHYEIAPGAALTCEWHPSIPFANASIDEQIDIDVAAGGRLSWSDAMMCGREGSGERWRFNTLARQLRLRRNGALAYLERYRVEPGARPVSTAWVAGDAAYLGTMLRVGMNDDADVAQRVHGQINAIAGVRGAADLLDEDLLLVRIAAAEGVPFHRARRVVAEALAAAEWCDELRSGS